MIRKNILLLNKKNRNNYKAVLTIIDNGADFIATLTNFNIPEGEYLIGVASNGEEVVNTKINLNLSAHTFKLPKNINMNNFNCVIVEKLKETIIPVVWGSVNGSNSNYEIVQKLYGNFKEEKNDNLSEELLNDSVKTASCVNNVNTKKEELPEQLFEENETEIEELITENLGSCQIDIVESSETKPNEEVITEGIFKNASKVKVEDEDNENFFYNLKEQIEDIFNSYPHDEKLAELIPNSIWANVNFEENSKNYVIGLIYEDDIVKYVCYGVPANFGEINDEKLTDYAQWLPAQNGDKEGYYIMYQNAETGEQIKLEV